MSPSIINSTQYEKLRVVQHYMQTASRIMFLTGAGISTNHGIPDFRSRDGLHHSNPRETLESLFNSITYADDEEKQEACAAIQQIHTSSLGKSSNAFFKLSSLQHPTSIRYLRTFFGLLHTKVSQIQPKANTVHSLISHIHREGRLQRCYTQNIDGLEERYGLQTDMRTIADTTCLPSIAQFDQFQVVQLHGDVGTVRCTTASCLEKLTTSTTRLSVQGSTYSCSRCSKRVAARLDCGKRAGISAEAIQLRPNIVLYDEVHPFAEHIQSVIHHDINQQIDLLVVVGTSLKIQGAQQLLKELAQVIHSRHGKVIYVNHTQTLHTDWDTYIDYFIQMDCDEWANMMISHENLESSESEWLTGAETEWDDEDWLIAYFDG